jgi:DNA-binding beta-propeller fold protein YncE
MKTWKAGDRQYELVEGWGILPSGWTWGQVAGVATDSEDNVHVFTRTDHPYMVFDKSGKLIDHWGEGIFREAHGVCITPDDSIFFVEHGSHVILLFDKHGRHRFTMGTRGVPSDTGYTKEIRDPDDNDPSIPGGEIGSRTEAWSAVNGVAYGGGPFNQPTDICVTPDGSIFVSDGYRNCRVHKFASDGTLIKSWGEPGNARELRNTKDKPGHFHTPHGIWAHKDKVYVSDRENNRIQIFTLDGDFVDIWTDYLRPTKIFIDPTEEVMYVSELDDRVSIVDLSGNVIGRIGAGHVIGERDGGRSHEPGEFFGPHSIWKDSEGSILVGEVLEGRRLQKFARTK